MSAVSQPPPGTEGLGWALEHYVIVRPIASGRFGSVFHATHATTGQSVALKLIPQHGPEGEEKVAAERHGAMLQQQFSRAHRNLVPEVFEHGPMREFYAIAMDFVAGEQLTDLIRNGPLAPARAATIALAIADFLARAHQFKTTIEGVDYELIVHADLKPDHILVLGDGGIRVLDFGIAKALEARSLVTTNKWGSIEYASPERLQLDGRVNEHADFWSLGVMLFEMVAGFRPYRRYDQNLSRLDRAVRTHEPPEPLPPQTDKVLAAIIRKLLAPQIERRYASATLIAQDLGAYLRNQPTMAYGEYERASQETVRVARGSAAPPPRTGPPASSPPNATTEAGAPAASAKSPGPSTLSRGGRLLRVAAALLLIGIGISETRGLAQADRLYARIATLEPADVDWARRQIRALGDRPFGLGARRVAGPLKERMLYLANRTILDYRTESPTVAMAHWQRARASLDLARELEPGDRLVAAKRAYVAGQIARIAATTRNEIDEAIRHFRESARLDPAAPDPYLGLARVAAYVTYDLDALETAIEAAASRGYIVGRRERAQLGDLHRTLADRARAAAFRLTGSSRVERLEAAANHYEECVGAFEGLRYFDSEGNLATCRRRLEAVSMQLPRTRSFDEGLAVEESGPDVEVDDDEPPPMPFPR